MNRNDFINLLYNNGNGLSLNQIQAIENRLPDLIPDGMIEDIAREYDNPNDPGILESAIYMCREHFINNLHDCGDMLELRYYLANNTSAGMINDPQIYGLFWTTRHID